MHATTAVLALAAAQGVVSQGFSQQAFSQLDGSRSSTEFDETPVIRYLFPAPRGASSLVANVGPCQGYDLGLRTQYPVSGGVISFANTVSIPSLEFRYSSSNDPQSEDDFEAALTNVTKPAQGQNCIAGPNFSALGLSAGDNATLQLYYEAGPRRTPQYQCADFTLVSEEDFEDANYETSCINHITSTQDMRDSAVNEHIVELREAKMEEVRSERAELEASYRKSNETLNTAEAGVVGAMVTLAVFLIIAITGFATGFLSFGRKNNRAASINSETSYMK